MNAAGSSKGARSALAWILAEGPPMLRGLALIGESQLGYEGRKAVKACRVKCLRIAVGGGNVVDPLNPASSTSNASLPVPPGLERLEAVTAGIKAFADMAIKGHLPGTGGQVLQNGKLVSSPRSQPVPNFAEAFQKDLFDQHTPAIPVTGKMSVKTPTTSSQLTQEEQEYLIKAARSVKDKEAEEELRSYYKPAVPVGYEMKSAEQETRKVTLGQERRVPASRIARFASFGRLAVGLSAGAVAEVTKRALNITNKEGGSERVLGVENPFLSASNANRIVATLCRVRGAALKLGQMLSIQDAETVPQALLDIFERVRNSADFMPSSQVNRQMRAAFGAEWRSLLKEFDERPFAAASIGQVHRAVLQNDREVAIKIQYPGVAEGIDSDIDNLVSVLSVGGIIPKNIERDLQKFVVVARRELKLECDYEREARASIKFRELLRDEKDFFVPEVFRWRFMQTDPNWSNFFFGHHPVTGQPQLILLDFGAARSYPKKFVDIYLRIIKAANDGNSEQIIQYSRDIGFLTGYENATMEKAHAESVLILAETLTSKGPYDFGRQNVTKRIHSLIPTMLEHRLTAPPEEVYSLHRKLSGAVLLATKLKSGEIFSVYTRTAVGDPLRETHSLTGEGQEDILLVPRLAITKYREAVVSCGPMFNSIYNAHVFGDTGEADIDIDTEPT